MICYLDVEENEVINQNGLDSKCRECIAECTDADGRRRLPCCSWGEDEPDEDHCFLRIDTSRHDCEVIAHTIKKIKELLPAKANLQFTSANEPFALTLAELNIALIDIEFDLKKEAGK